MGRSLVLICWCLHLAMALDRPVVEVRAEPATAAIGDEIDVIVTYRWPTGWLQAEPDPTSAFATLFITACPPPERTATAQEQQRTWRFRVLVQRSGAWALPRPSITPTGPEGPVTATAPEVVVTVGTEAAPAVPAAPRPLWLRDEQAPDAGWRWWAAAGAGLLALAIGLIAWRIGRRRTVLAIPPIATFREECESAAICSDGKEAGARLSLALRRYCGACFSFDGLGATTRECSLHMRGEVLDAEHGGLCRLLGELDDLRWAAEALPLSATIPLRDRALAWAEGLQGRLDHEAAEAARAAGQTHDTAGRVA